MSSMKSRIVNTVRRVGARIVCAHTKFTARRSVGTVLCYAFSVDTIVTGYTGAVLRVRRSSDNAEQDFSNKNDIAAWVGVGNDGYVTVWYDQSGLGNNAVQTTAANQPIIVSAGVLTDGVTFITANALYLTIADAPSLDITVPPNFSFLVDFYNADATNGWFLCRAATSYSNCQYAFFSKTTDIVETYINGGMRAATTAAFVGGNSYKLVITYNGQTVTNYINTIFDSETAYANNSLPSRTVTVVGARPSDATFAQYYQGRIRSIVVYKGIVSQAQIQAF